MSWREQADVLERMEGAEAAAAMLAGAAHGLPADHRFEIAMRLKAMQRLPDALAILADLADRDGEARQFHAMLELATCLALDGRPDEAQAPLARAAVLDPGSHWPVSGEVALRLAAGDEAGALGLIEAAYDALRPDGKAELAQRHARIVARRRVEQMGGFASRPPCLPGRVPALAQAGLVMMVKDEADILLQNLTHHYALGFRCFCILDNNSTDETASRIAFFRAAHPDALVLSVADPVVGYYQSAKMAVFQDTLRHYAAIAGIVLEWMFFIDADEFIAHVGAPGTAAIEALQAALLDPAAGLLILHWVHGATRQALPRLDPHDDPLRLFDRRPCTLEPVVSKIAYRTGLGLSPMMGNHFVASYDRPLHSVRTLALHDWHLMHYPMRSLEHVRRKVVNGGRAFQGASGLETHGGHWRERYAQYERDGDAALVRMLEAYIEGIR